MTIVASHTEEPFTILSLCSGVGMLDLGIRLAVPRARTVCYVEREAPAVATLVERFEDRTLCEAPVWSDLETFPSNDFQGVDLLCAGFPCQPFSSAGKRLGQEDERWLWPVIDGILRGVRPRFVLLENVPGLTIHGLDAVLGTLAELGFNAEWDLFRASDIGAPHKRERFFLLAVADASSKGLPISRPRGERESRPEKGEGVDGGSQLAGGELDNPKSERFEPGRLPERTEAKQPEPCFSIHGEELANPDRLGLQIRHEDKPKNVESFPPSPSGDWRNVPEILRPALPQSQLRRLANGSASRVDRLRAAGNGVVPGVVALAVTVLAERLGVGEMMRGDYDDSRTFTAASKASGRR